MMYVCSKGHQSVAAPKDMLCPHPDCAGKWEVVRMVSVGGTGGAPAAVGMGIDDKALQDLADNPSQRLPCVLVLDGSGSMQGAPIDALNAGLKTFEEQLKGDSVARLRVQVAVLWLGGEDEVDVLLDWTDAKDFTAPVVKARGRTPLGKAVRLALSKIEDQKGRYNQSGVAYNRPWVFVITDGEPTDHDWEQAAAECQQAEQARKAVVYGVAVGEGNLEKLARFCNPERRPLRLQGLEFKKLFVWLSRSTSSASRETPGQTKELAPITWSAPT